MAYFSISESLRRIIAHWLPVLAAALVTWLAFVLLRQTPIIRALAFALVIMGVSLTLRPFGAALAFTGGLALAFSQAFWSQAGGRASIPAITLLLVVTGVAAAVLIWLSKKPYLGIGAGVALFIILFWTLASTERSLRLTTLLSAWLFYLLTTALIQTNPRPDGPPPAPLSTAHIIGLLLLLTLGAINDPLFALLAPAVILGLVLSRNQLFWWHWLWLAGVVIYSAQGIAVQYLDSDWWLYPAASAQNIHVPFVIADGWRQAWRWLDLLSLVTTQFTVVGVALGVLGLARMARWYPTLGIVTMVAYAAYALFGLAYFGRDSAVLLLPLFMIQVFWMTYAVYAFGQWLQKSFTPTTPLVRWIAPALFFLIPVVMLVRIAE